jgi:hypothetical protein
MSVAVIVRLYDPSFGLFGNALVFNTPLLSIVKNASALPEIAKVTIPLAPLSKSTTYNTSISRWSDREKYLQISIEFNSENVSSNKRNTNAYIKYIE